MRRLKIDIVRVLLPDVPEAHRETEEQAMITWWANIRRGGGMRLTVHGYHMLCLAGAECWCVEFPAKKLTGIKSLVLAMDRKIEWPYFVDAKKGVIQLFGSREAMMATLYGDLTKWLQNK